MISKVFVIIAVICFGLASLAWFLWEVFKNIRLPRWFEDALGWTFVIGMPVGIVCITIGCVAFVLGV